MAKTYPVPKIGLNVQEAARASGLGVDVIRAAVQRGELPAKGFGLHGPGRRFVILTANLERWLSPDKKPSAPAEISAHG